LLSVVTFDVVHYSPVSFITCSIEIYWPKHTMPVAYVQSSSIAAHMVRCFFAVAMFSHHQA